jgi:hypothetical protein
MELGNPKDTDRAGIEVFWGLIRTELVWVPLEVWVVTEMFQ